MVDTTTKITIKLRDSRTTPPQTRLFSLPVPQLIQTSAYFRAHLQSPLTRHRDGIFRLNFPDFALFEIYAEWVSSGELFTKSGLTSLHSPSKTSSRLSEEEKARRAYEDYLGAWFLGSWVQDSAFQEKLVSTMKAKMEGGCGHPRMFVKALMPGLVDVLWEGSKGAEPFRLFVYEAVARFGTKEDVERFVPDEGQDVWPRTFVRGLLGYLYERQNRGGGNMEGMRRESDALRSSDAGMNTLVYQSTASTAAPSLGSDFTRTTTTLESSNGTPPPFMGTMKDMWEPASHVSWPSTTSSSTVLYSDFISGSAGSASTSTYHTASLGQVKDYENIT